MNNKRERYSIPNFRFKLEVWKEKVIVNLSFCGRSGRFVLCGFEVNTSRKSKIVWCETLFLAYALIHYLSTILLFLFLLFLSLISPRVVCFELSNDYSASGIGISGRNPELV